MAIKLHHQSEAAQQRREARRAKKRREDNLSFHFIFFPLLNILILILILILSLSLSLNLSLVFISILIVSSALLLLPQTLLQCCELANAVGQKLPKTRPKVARNWACTPSGSPNTIRSAKHPLWANFKQKNNKQEGGPEAWELLERD